MMETSAPAPPARSNSFERIIGLFTAPVQTMREIAARPDWLVPFLLIAVLTAIASWAAAPKMDLASELRPQFEKQLRARDIPEDKIDETVSKQLEVAKKFAVFGALMIPLLLLISAAVFLGAFNIFGGSLSFLQSLSVVTYGWVVLTLRGLIASFVVAMRSDDTTPTGMIGASYTNPSFLVDPLTHRALAIAVSPLDVLGIFALFLMIVGFSFASGLSRKASAAIVITLWAVVFLTRLVPALLQS